MFLKHFLLGEEIRTHYPRTRQAGMAITSQEAWTARSGGARPPHVPPYVAEIVEEAAFVARGHSKIDKRSGVSQRMPITCLENAVSNAERRGLLNAEPAEAVRVADVYAALPSVTGKFELEYEGELRGAGEVARDVIRTAVARVFEGWFGTVDTAAVVEWFDLGGALDLGDETPAADLLEQTGQIHGLHELAGHLRVDADEPAALASAVEFILEGLYARKKISRNDAWRYSAVETRTSRRAAMTPERMLETEVRVPPDKKKYYN